MGKELTIMEIDVNYYLNKMKEMENNFFIKEDWFEEFYLMRQKRCKWDIL